ncbi:hypothetical protein LT493_12580 [Streptomyces tricolor]|nr:hypothetical protein [Streptomyces tricolor]
MPEREPEETCQVVLNSVAPAHPRDDIALLVARTRALAPTGSPPGTCGPDPALVGEVRARALRQLADWGTRRGRVRRGADAQRAGHQRHPPRFRSRPAYGCCARPHPDLRGPRRQHTAPHLGRRPAPTRAAGACSSSLSWPGAGARATCPRAKSSGPNAARRQSGDRRPSASQLIYRRDKAVNTQASGQTT